jgi:hypothetical protein
MHGLEHVGEGREDGTGLGSIFEFTEHERDVGR